MFGKNKTYTADEILELIAALPEKEKEKVRTSIAGEEKSPEESETSPPEETPAEEPDRASEGAPAEEPAPPEGNDAGGEEPPKDSAPEEEAPENEAMQALAARVEALEQKLEELIEKQEEAVKAEENADFGGYASSAPDAPAEDSERYDAVMRGYAGRNADRY